MTYLYFFLVTNFILLAHPFLLGATNNLHVNGHCEVPCLKVIMLPQQPTCSANDFTGGTEQNVTKLKIHKMISFDGLTMSVNHVVTVGLGGRYLTLLLDTGSDLTWVQCEPCVYCYDQEEPIFNPSRSPSYKPILCDSITCKNSEYTNHDCGINSSTCEYHVTYADWSYSSGILASDNLVLGMRLVKDFVFGCGRVSYGLFGRVSGLIGLAKSGHSPISKTYGVSEGVFSYCLASLNEEGSGSLIFGDDASLYKNITPISYTNLITNTNMPDLYFVNLTGISFDGVSLQDPSFGQKEMLIDSGTLITRLSPMVYEAVKKEFIKHFADFPRASPFSFFDTCFNLSGYYKVPTMEMHFGAEAMLEVNEILHFANIDRSHVCLAVVSSMDEGSVGIIGSYQQTNTRVVYNNKESRIGFAKEICSLDY